MSRARVTPLRAVRDEGASRQRILDTATELLARYGFEGMSMQMLADEVGLHKSTLFHHFRGKEELIVEVVRVEIELLLKSIENLAAADPPSLDQLVEVTEKMVDHFGEQRWAALLLMRGMLGPDNFERGSDATGPLVLRLFTIMGGWLDRARRAGVIRPVRVRQALMNLVGLTLFYPAMAEDEMAQQIIGGDPRSPRALRARKEELSHFLRGAFSPTADR